MHIPQIYAQFCPLSGPMILIQHIIFNFSKFVSAFIDFPKPLIGLINGPAVGVSVTVLGLFDAVYATDRVCLLSDSVSLSVPL